MNWDLNGNLMNKVEYLNNKLHGKWIEYYVSGKIECITNYEFDLKHGTEICFYENGNKKFERKYKEDMPASEITRWKNNGDLIK